MDDFMEIELRLMRGSFFVGRGSSFLSNKVLLRVLSGRKAVLSVFVRKYQHVQEK